MIPTALTIAGTDPSGGAGISADLKTFSALGAFGTAVVTAVVAQNTRGVAAVHQLTGAQVRGQLENLLEDVHVDTLKLGMLGTADVIEEVAAVLEPRPVPSVVLDPVMVASSGDRLLDPDAVEALRERLLPCCDLITPNIPEAADLLGTEPAQGLTQMARQLEALRGLSPNVLVKGGHLDGPDSTDLLYAEGRIHELTAPRVHTSSTHGTGCTLSAAAAALHPLRGSWYEAVREAKDYLTGALQAADRLHVGSGHGPVHHFHAVWT